MQPHEQAQFLSAVGEFVRDQVRSATEPLLAKIAELENRVKFVDAGWTGDMEAVRSCLKECVTVDQMRNISTEVTNSIIKSDKECGLLCDFDETVSAAVHQVRNQLKELGLATEDPSTLKLLPVVARDGKDGTSVTLEEVIAVMDEPLNKRVSEYIAGLPIVKDGKDGRDGTSVSVEDVKQALLPEVQEFLRSIPLPEKGEKGEDGKDGKDGTSVHLDDVLAGVRGLVAEAVDAIPVPRSVVGAVIDRDGDLCVVLSDGESKKLGRVVGEDGLPGKDGVSIPGKDGENGKDGKDGRDGLGFKDMSVTFDGERSFIFKFALEDRVEELSLKVPFMIYRGVWRAGLYERGDCVTRDGSMFVAREDTDKQPGTIESGWQLATKRGRDGRDGDKGDKGDPGSPGKKGQDLTQLGPDGKKWG